MSLQPVSTASSRGIHVKSSALDCENGRHSAIGSSKIEIGGIVHAVCRHCGYELMRLGSSRRWFRRGEMGR